MSKAFNQFLKELETNKLPPVGRWNPSYEADLDLFIDGEGKWFYQGTPFQRHKLVNLLSTLLKIEDDNYFLVSPREKLKITVEDVPFIVTDVETIGDSRERQLIFATGTGDKVLADRDHQIEIRQREQDIPYLHVRNGLFGRINRNVFYRLVDWGEETLHDNQNCFGIWSNGCFFNFGPVQW